MPDYSRDPVRRVPAAMLAHAFATGALDRAEYEDRLDRLREDPPDLTRLLWRLPQPAYVTRGVNAVLSAPDRAYARALLGVLEGVPDDPADPRRRLADRIEAAFTVGDPHAITAAQVRATHQDRRMVLKLLRAAERDGRLGVAEYAEREQQAAAAKNDEELSALLADLRRPSSTRTGRRETRASAQDRQDTANGLQQAPLS